MDEQRLKDRIIKLNNELEHGHSTLQRVESHRTQLIETIHRISGAIQVLQELLAEDQSEELCSNVGTVSEAS